MGRCTYGPRHKLLMGHDKRRGFVLWDRNLYNSYISLDSWNHFSTPFPAAGGVLEQDGKETSFPTTTSRSLLIQKYRRLLKQAFFFLTFYRRTVTPMVRGPTPDPTGEMSFDTCEFILTYSLLGRNLFILFIENLGTTKLNSEVYKIENLSKNILKKYPIAGKK